MLMYRSKISFIYRKYSQAAASATAVSNTAKSHSHDTNQRIPSFAKSLYVGNFVKDVFIRSPQKANIQKCEKLFGISVPKEFGGLELSSASISAVYKNTGLSTFKDYIAHGTVVKCINTFGTRDLKENYLPKLASGEYVATLCCYENDYGYDIQNTETTASLKNGKWVINGSKQWVVNGKQANVFLILAKTMDECNRPESDQNFFTTFLVKKENNGIQISSEGDFCSITFNNVKADCVLGSENEGLTIFSLLFNADLLESSSSTLGELKTIIQNSSKNLNNYDQCRQVKLGKLNSHLYTMDCVLDFTSHILDSYNPQSDYEPILARLFINETTRSCLNLLNDLGISTKEYKYIENSLLFEGKSNLLTYVGALLGVQYAGQYMSDEVRQLRNPLMFPKYTMLHILKIHRSLKDKPKLKGYVQNYMHPSLKKQALDLEYCLSRFQFGIQNMFTNLGPDTCYFQMILERANNIAVDLFAMTAVLHRVSHKLSTSNSQLNPTELIFTNVYGNGVRQNCSRRVQEILDAPHNVIDPHLKTLGQNCFVEKNYFFEHPLKRNII